MFKSEPHCDMSTLKNATANWLILVKGRRFFNLITFRELKVFPAWLTYITRITGSKEAILSHIRGIYQLFIK